MYRIWVISLSGQKLIYSRHFPHLEKHDSFNFPSITPNEFIKSIFSSLGIGYTHTASNEGHNSTSTILNDYDCNKMSRSSSSSSISSFVSSTTTTSSNKTKNFDGSVPESTISFDYSVLHNYLPLIICRFMNNPRENQTNFSSTMEEYQKFAFVDLIMLVFEKNGFLFVCCPRLETLSRLSPTNIESDYEKLLLEEQSISLAYTAMQLFSTTFFSENKSIKHLELFITNCMPFGTLIKNGFEFNQSKYLNSEKKMDKSNNEGLIRLCINEFVSTSFQAFNRASTNQFEMTFGTLSIDYPNLNATALSKAELKLSVNNLNSFFKLKPANCDIVNSSTLNYDLKYPKIDPLNILHYRAMMHSSDEESKRSSSPSLDSVPNFNNRKLFSYRYVISKKDSSLHGASKNLISTKNCHHISISLAFNSRILLDEIKFVYFMIKFTFNHVKSRKEVQTIDSSVSNLTVRESVKASFGQVRIEGGNFVWVLGQKIPRSAKLSLEFDLLIDEDKLPNLETMCNLRFDHKMAVKFLYLKKIPQISDGINHSKITSSHMEKRDLEEIRECHFNYPSRMIEPQMSFSKLMLFTELDATKSMRSVIAERKEETKLSNTAIIEYRLSSFEYRLFPDMSLLSYNKN